MSITMIQLPEEFFDIMNTLQRKLDMINYNIEKIESLNVELIETMDKTNNLLEKAVSALEVLNRK